MRDRGLDVELLDNLLNQVPTSKVKSVLEEKMPAPNSDIGEPEQSGRGLTPVLPDFYLADTALCNVYVFKVEMLDPFKAFISDIIQTDPVDIAHSYFSKIPLLL